MTFFVPFGDQASRRRIVLLTGATGAVGTALLPQLRRHRVIVLAHRRVIPGNVITMPGEVTHPGLGLPVDRYRELARNGDVVVPAAAGTGLPVVTARPPALVPGRCQPPGDPPRRARRWR
jgi:nucleoside-diphosphate-sugar epimerase